MAKKKYDHVDIEYVVDQYINHKRTSVELAEELGVSDWWIRDRLIKEKISIRPQGGGLTTIDLTGQRFGNYTVMEKVIKSGNSQGARWKLLCDCGNLREAYSSPLRSGQITSCGYCNGVHHLWKGFGDLSGSHFEHIKKNAAIRSLVFEVEKEQLWNLFLEQDGKCNLSGIPLSLIKKNTKNEKIERTASLDRIDSSKGYIKENVQWIHKDINQMKWHLDQDYFLKMCKMITNNQIDLD